MRPPCATRTPLLLDVPISTPVTAFTRTQVTFSGTDFKVKPSGVCRIPAKWWWWGFDCGFVV